MFTFHYKTAARKQWAMVELASAKSTIIWDKKNDTGMQQLSTPGPSYFFQYLFQNTCFIAPRN